MFRISVFGLGYVGSVTAACLAETGCSVLGVDSNKTKVAMINEGKSPVIEKNLEDIIAKNVKRGALKATTDGKYSVLNTDISLVCVGTPSNLNGSLNLEYVQKVINEIGDYIQGKTGYHLIALRSTIVPGTTEDILIPQLERISQKKFGREFGVVVNPEFMRESSAVYDFYNPPKIVIGRSQASDADAISRLYQNINAPLIETSFRVAEMIKNVDNCFHALKIVFSNEIGNLCSALKIDSHEVMKIFCQDEKLNISPAYLKPGFAFGGSCLPKDLRAITYLAKSVDVNVPVLNAILPSNELQVKNAIQRILGLRRKRIGVLGFAFKAGTDDLRESPLVELIEALLGKGLQIKIYDRDVALARLTGTNKEYIETHIPHIADLMVENIQEILIHSEIIIIGNKNEEFRKIFPHLKGNQHVLDLVRISESVETSAKYEGISW